MAAASNCSWRAAAAHRAGQPLQKSCGARNPLQCRMQLCSWIGDCATSCGMRQPDLYWVSGLHRSAFHDSYFSSWFFYSVESKGPSGSFDAQLRPAVLLQFTISPCDFPHVLAPSPTVLGGAGVMLTTSHHPGSMGASQTSPRSGSAHLGTSVIPSLADHTGFQVHGVMYLACHWPASLHRVQQLSYPWISASRIHHPFRRLLQLVTRLSDEHPVERL